MLKVLDLFAGIGGFSYGLEATGGFSTTAFCEIDPFCQKVLQKHWRDVPIHADIKGTDFEQYKGKIDVITGGYPCQPFSNAGKQRGEEDPRHLWPRMREIIEQVRPAWIICENVHGHIKLGLDKVLLDLENLGYTTRTFVVPACGVNAPHRRNRIWIVAYSEHYGSSSPQDEGEIRKNAPETQEGQEQSIKPTGVHSPGTVVNSESERVQGLWEGGEQEPHPYGEQELPLRPSEDVAHSISQRGCGRTTNGKHAKNARQSPFSTIGQRGRFNFWDVESPVGRVANGIPDRVHRLKALGNSVVPQIVFNIGKAILHVEEKKEVPKRKAV